MSLDKWRYSLQGGLVFLIMFKIYDILKSKSGYENLAWVITSVLYTLIIRIMMDIFD